MAWPSLLVIGAMKAGDHLAPPLPRAAPRRLHEHGQGAGLLRLWRDGPQRLPAPHRRAGTRGAGADRLPGAVRRRRTGQGTRRVLRALSLRRASSPAASAPAFPASSSSPCRAIPSRVRIRTTWRWCAAATRRSRSPMRSAALQGPRRGGGPRRSASRSRTTPPPPGHVIPSGANARRSAVRRGVRH